MHSSVSSLDSVLLRLVVIRGRGDPRRRSSHLNGGFGVAVLARLLMVEMVVVVVWAGMGGADVVAGTGAAAAAVAAGARHEGLEERLQERSFWALLGWKRQQLAWRAVELWEVVDAECLGHYLVGHWKKV